MKHKRYEQWAFIRRSCHVLVVVFLLSHDSFSFCASSARQTTAQRWICAPSMTPPNLLNDDTAVDRCSATSSTTPSRCWTTMLRWRVLSASLWSLVAVVSYVREARSLHFSVF